MEHIAALISGGVDSAVAVHLLCEQGYRPDLFYIRIGMEGEEELTCTAEEDIELCTATARRYGLRLETVDLQREYWDQVVSYTIDRVRRGLTPNPDVMCNKLIKFGCFEQQAGHLYTKTATGHYADILDIDGRKWLATAADSVKDQTDFLAQIDSLQVARLIFPLGRLTKHEVRDIARRAHLPSALRRDSQGICFLGKINYNDFIRRFLGERPGPVIEWETGRQIGTHRGYWFHTIGQRRGLRLSGGPWFVVQKDIRENILYVSHGNGTAGICGTEFHISGFHFVTDDPWQGCSPVEVSFKIRHTDAFTRGTLVRDENTWHIVSRRPLQGIAPGQFAVLYDEQARICVGSGEICL